MTMVRTYRWVALAAVGCAVALGQSGQLAHAAKKAKKHKSKQVVGQGQFPPLMVLSTKRNLSNRITDEYFRRMTESGRIAPHIWWLQSDIQAKPRQVVEDAGKNGDGYVWVSEPSTHKKMMVGEVKSPLIELGAVREAQVDGGRLTAVGRYRCKPSTYKRFYDQHQSGPVADLPNVLMIDPYVPKDPKTEPRFKERELLNKERELLNILESKEPGGPATRITASFAMADDKDTDDGNTVDALHLQLVGGGEICFTVDRPLVVSRLTYEPIITLHTRESPTVFPVFRYLDKLPSPERVDLFLNAAQTEQGSLLQRAQRHLK